MSKKLSPKDAIALFEGTEIRKTWHQDAWWFSIVDVIALLDVTGREPRKYWSDLKKKISDEGYSEVSEKIGQLKLIASDGKMRRTDCSDTVGILRIIQSVPSPRAEPFKQWLATVGAERIDEINDPELSMQRMINTYEKKGYPKEWIDVRTRGISVRNDLTNERQERGGDRAYGLLTNEIYQAYAGMSNKEWKEYKGIDKGNLRDGMSPTELILTMLAEQSTTDITTARDAQGVDELKKAGKDGGGVAFTARKELEDQTGKDPISDNNYLEEVKKKQLPNQDKNKR